MDLFLKFLIFGGKYLSQLTAQSIVEAYKRSVQLGRILNNQCTPSVSVVGNYDNILDLYNSNFEEFQHSNPHSHLAFISDEHRKEFETYLKDVEQHFNEDVTGLFQNTPPELKNECGSLKRIAMSLLNTSTGASNIESQNSSPDNSVTSTPRINCSENVASGEESQIDQVDQVARRETLKYLKSTSLLSSKDLNEDVESVIKSEADTSILNNVAEFLDRQSEYIKHANNTFRQLQIDISLKSQQMKQHKLQEKTEEAQREIDFMEKLKSVQREVAHCTSLMKCAQTRLDIQAENDKTKRLLSSIDKIIKDVESITDLMRISDINFNGLVAQEQDTLLLDVNQNAYNKIVCRLLSQQLPIEGRASYSTRASRSLAYPIEDAISMYLSKQNSSEFEKIMEINQQVFEKHERTMKYPLIGRWNNRNKTSRKVRRTVKKTPKTKLTKTTKKKKFRNTKSRPSKFAQQKLLRTPNKELVLQSHAALSSSWIKDDHAFLNIVQDSNEGDNCSEMPSSPRIKIDNAIQRYLNLGSFDNKDGGNEYVVSTVDKKLDQLVDQILKNVDPDSIENLSSPITNIEASLASIKDDIDKNMEIVRGSRTSETTDPLAFNLVAMEDVDQEIMKQPEVKVKHLQVTQIPRLSTEKKITNKKTFDKKSLREAFDEQKSSILAKMQPKGNATVSPKKALKENLKNKFESHKQIKKPVSAGPPQKTIPPKKTAPPKEKCPNVTPAKSKSMKVVLEEEPILHHGIDIAAILKAISDELAEKQRMTEFEQNFSLLKLANEMNETAQNMKNIFHEQKAIEKNLRDVLKREETQAKELPENVFVTNKAEPPKAIIEEPVKEPQMVFDTVKAEPPKIQNRTKWLHDFISNNQPETTKNIIPDNQVTQRVKDKYSKNALKYTARDSTTSELNRNWNLWKITNAQPRKVCRSYTVIKTKSNELTLGDMINSNATTRVFKPNNLDNSSLHQLRVRKRSGTPSTSQSLLRKSQPSTSTTRMRSSKSNHIRLIPINLLKPVKKSRNKILTPKKSEAKTRSSPATKNQTSTDKYRSDCARPLTIKFDKNRQAVDISENVAKVSIVQKMSEYFFPQNNTSTLKFEKVIGAESNPIIPEDESSQIRDNIRSDLEALNERLRVAPYKVDDHFKVNVENLKLEDINCTTATIKHPGATTSSSEPAVKFKPTIDEEAQTMIDDSLEYQKVNEKLKKFSANNMPVQIDRNVRTPRKSSTEVEPTKSDTTIKSWKEVEPKETEEDTFTKKSESTETLRSHDNNASVKTSNDQYETRYFMSGPDQIIEETIPVSKIQRDEEDEMCIEIDRRFQRTPRRHSEASSINASEGSPRSLDNKFKEVLGDYHMQHNEESVQRCQQSKKILINYDIMDTNEDTKPIEDDEKSLYSEKHEEKESSQNIVLSDVYKDKCTSGIKAHGVLSQQSRHHPRLQISPFNLEPININPHIVEVKTKELLDEFKARVEASRTQLNKELDLNVKDEEQRHPFKLEIKSHPKREVSPSVTLRTPRAVLVPVPVEAKLEPVAQLASKSSGVKTEQGKRGEPNRQQKSTAAKSYSTEKFVNIPSLGEPLLDKLVVKIAKDDDIKSIQGSVNQAKTASKSVLKFVPIHRNKASIVSKFAANEAFTANTSQNSMKPVHNVKKSKSYGDSMTTSYQSNIKKTPFLSETKLSSGHSKFQKNPELAQKETDSIRSFNRLQSNKLLERKSKRSLLSSYSDRNIRSDTNFATTTHLLNNSRPKESTQKNSERDYKALSVNPETNKPTQKASKRQESQLKTHDCDGQVEGSTLLMNDVAENVQEVLDEHSLKIKQAVDKDKVPDKVLNTEPVERLMINDEVETILSPKTPPVKEEVPDHKPIKMAMPKPQKNVKLSEKLKPYLEAQEKREQLAEKPLVQVGPLSPVLEEPTKAITPVTPESLIEKSPLQSPIDMSRVANDMITSGASVHYLNQLSSHVKNPAYTSFIEKCYPEEKHWADQETKTNQKNADRETFFVSQPSKSTHSIKMQKKEILETFNLSKEVFLCVDKFQQPTKPVTKTLSKSILQNLNKNIKASHSTPTLNKPKKEVKPKAPYVRKSINEEHMPESMRLRSSERERNLRRLIVMEEKVKQLEGKRAKQEQLRGNPIVSVDGKKSSKYPDISYRQIGTRNTEPVLRTSAPNRKSFSNVNKHDSKGNNKEGPTAEVPFEAKQLDKFTEPDLEQKPLVQSQGKVIDQLEGKMDTFLPKHLIPAETFQWKLPLAKRKNLLPIMNPELRNTKIVVPKKCDRNSDDPPTQHTGRKSHPSSAKPSTGTTFQHTVFSERYRDLKQVNSQTILNKNVASYDTVKLVVTPEKTLTLNTEEVESSPTEKYQPKPYTMRQTSLRAVEETCPKSYQFDERKTTTLKTFQNTVVKQNYDLQILKKSEPIQKPAIQQNFKRINDYTNTFGKHLARLKAKSERNKIEAVSAEEFQKKLSERLQAMSALPQVKERKEAIEKRFVYTPPSRESGVRETRKPSLSEVKKTIIKHLRNSPPYLNKLSMDLERSTRDAKNSLDAFALRPMSTFRSQMSQTKQTDSDEDKE